jgi:hypothetical protein
MYVIKCTTNKEDQKIYFWPATYEKESLAYSTFDRLFDLNHVEKVEIIELETEDVVHMKKKVH